MPPAGKNRTSEKDRSHTADVIREPCGRPRACMRRTFDSLEGKMRKLLLAVAFTAVLGLALLPQGAVGQKSIKDQILGTWVIVSLTQTMKDGSTRHPLGMNPMGVNVFTPDGRYVVLFTRDNLPKLAGGDRGKATADEATAIVGGSIGYFGSYTVDEPNKTIVYRLEGTTFPNQMGTDQRRVITLLTADELKYGNPGATSGGAIEVSFKRAK
jgi:Lipocalin-like domain